MVERETTVEWLLTSSSDCPHFLKKKNILISWRYQLHLTSAPIRCFKNIQNAHNPKRKQIRKKNKGLATAINSSQQQHSYHHQIQHPENIKGFQKQWLQEGNSAQASSLPDPRIICFHPGERPCSQNNTFGKAIARHKQWRLDLKFSS